MAEVSVPSLERQVHCGNDALQALAIIAPCLRTQRLLELLYTFLPRPAFAAASEVIAQEVEPGFCLMEVHQSGLLGMQPQSCRFDPLLDRPERFLRFDSAPAQDDEVVRVAHQLPTALLHQQVERVEVE